MPSVGATSMILDPSLSSTLVYAARSSASTMRPSALWNASASKSSRSPRAARQDAESAPNGSDT